LRTEETIQRIEQLASVIRTKDQTSPQPEARDIGLPSLPWMSGLAVTALVLVAVTIGVLFSTGRARIREQAAAPASTQTVAAPVPTQVAAPAAIPVAAARPIQSVAASSRQPLPAPLLTANASPSNREESASVRDRQSLPRPSTPTPRQVFVGTLSISSVPSGASVSINGKAAGVTPLRLPRQPAGSLAVQIAQDGFERWSAAVRVPADQLTQVTARLRPIAQ
jgi:PEGA domain